MTNILQEHDIILEINGVNVHNMPHNNVVALLSDCDVNSSAIFVVQRHPLVMYGHPYNGQFVSTNPTFLPPSVNHSNYQYNENNSNLRVGVL